MTHPTSFRLSESLLHRLEEDAASRQMSVTALVTTLLDEGLKTTRFPGLVYRDGPTGRRAGIAGGPDVWEVVRDLRRAPGKSEQRLAVLAEELGLSLRQIHLAVDFYAAFPEEIDTRVAADERAASRLRQQMAQRQRILMA